MRVAPEGPVGLEPNPSGDGPPPDGTRPRRVEAEYRAGPPLPGTRGFAILVTVSAPHTDDPVVVVVLDGGPMDGREHHSDRGADELSVVMTDGQRHRYARTGDVQALPDGRSALVFAWTGRAFGSEG